jgi:hypothetical protein
VLGSGWLEFGEVDITREGRFIVFEIKLGVLEG